MAYGLKVNENQVIWIENVSFFDVSLVAGREQSVASLSFGGRDLTGISKTWATASLTIGDHLSILRQARPPSSESCSTRVTSISPSGNRKISGFALNLEGEHARVVEISRHDQVQATVIWDAASDVVRVSLDALTSNDEGFIDGFERFFLEQSSESFRSIHIQIV